MSVKRQMPRCLKPCGRCPWRKDVSPGEFSLERFKSLWNTSHQPDPNAIRSGEDVLGQPMFACHKTPEGNEKSCAGWLAVAGYNNLAVRYAVAVGTLPESALTPGDGWPELFSSFEEMVERQARRT
ncbi:DUF6283 family protein [Streptomyces sp. NPDC008079]|uniref:DUF6283 family protein n=1 Tax=Streptomyces sp. NPDC008079 TaxID=3364806 RepID=UPI0036E4251C